MNTWSERLQRTLLQGDEVLACSDHENLLRDFFDSDADYLSDETIARIDEVVHCDACRLVVAIVTGDLAWLETQPDLAAPGSRNENLHTAARESPREPHSIGDCAVVEAQHTPMDDGSQPQVHGLQPVSSERARNVNQRQLPFVKTLSVVRTSGVETRIRNPRTTVEVTNIFAPEVKDLNRISGDTTCLAGVFHTRQGEARWPSYDVDEICYVHLNGRMVLEFDGAEPVTLNADDAVQVLWLPSTRNGVTNNRTPPARVDCKTDWVAGLLVLLRKAGVRWDGSHSDYIVTPKGMDDMPWQTRSTAEYWQSVTASFPGLFNERRPFVSKIPLLQASIEEEFRSLRMSSHMNRDYHRDARAAGQLDYAEVRGWQSGVCYKNTRRRPIFDFRLLLFPGRASTVEKDKVWLAKHQNGYEILVPLVGDFRCVGGEIESEEFMTHDGQDINAFVPRDEGIDPSGFTESYVQAPTVGGRCLPDYVAVCSDAVFHGFTAMHGRDAYVLHIRVGRAITARAKERDEERDMGTQRHMTGGDR